MTPLLALMALGRFSHTGSLGNAIVDREDAISRAKKVLDDFDVPRPFRVLKTYPPDSESWAVYIQAGNHPYDIHFARSGRVRYIERSDWLGGMIQNPPDPGASERVRRWLRNFNPTLTTEPRWSSRNETTFFSFSPIVQGHSFVYSRLYLGYGFTLMNGELSSFRADEELPPFGPATAKITEAKAEGITESIFLSRYLPEFAKRGAKATYGETHADRLGWATTLDAKKVALAWRVYSSATVEYEGHIPSPYGQGILIDANTGKQIEADTSV